MHKGTILYMGNFELPDKNAAAHRVSNNGKIFKKLGYNVAYLGTVRDENFVGIKVSSYNADIYEEAYPLGTKQWIKHIFDTSNILKVAEHYDDVCLVIVYNVPYATFKSVKKAFAEKNIKVAYDCTEWNGFAEGSLPKRLYKKIDEFQIRNFLSNACNDIIVISNLMAEKYKDANLLKLPPLIDLDDDIWHQDKIKTDGEFVFCFAGTISNKEKIQNIVSAFSNIHNISLRLKLIGVTAEEYLQGFPEHANILKNDKRIDFIGKLSHKETVQHVLSCDCYIFIRESTRRNEAGFPTKYAESFTCGVPIISTNVSDIKAFSDDRVLLLNSTDEKIIQDAMIKVSAGFNNDCVLDSKFDYRQYVEPAKEWITKIFD